VTTHFSPDPAAFEPVELPGAWPSRRWIYANVITSRNGIVSWTRAGTHDDPVRAIAGGDFTRPGRRADMRLMRRLRAGADAVSFGAQGPTPNPEPARGGFADAQQRGLDVGKMYRALATTWPKASRRFRRKRISCRSSARSDRERVGS
jgi:hypothetical protein